MDFKNPPECYRGLDLYMVNDRLDDDEIVHQIHEFHDKGLYSVIFRTYNGLYSDYPGREFQHKVRVAVNAARDCGLKIVLQAGYMPSAFPNLPKQYALHHIHPTPESELVGDEKILLVKNGVAYVDALIPAAVNMLEPDATDFYIRTTYEEMWADFTDEFGKTVISVWVDEPRFNNVYMVWTDSLEADYQKKYGESLTVQLDSLYENVGNYQTVRYRYFILLREKMQVHYFTKVRDWCHSHNLTFSGHLMGEEYLVRQVSQGCALMPFYPYFDIPGIDMLRTHHEWNDRTLAAPELKPQEKIISTLQCVSAALQSGKEHILCEMYGVTSPSMSFRDDMHLFDFFASHGINHQCMHALFYSVGGFRKRFYPQQYNVYQPFWDNFREIKDYVARVSQFVGYGHSTVDTLVLHPLETAYMKVKGLQNPKDLSPRADVDAYDSLFGRIVNTMHGEGISFHFGDQTLTEELGSVKDGRFIIGEMAYCRVILPSLWVLNRKTWELLRQFASEGGEILILGDIPTYLDGVYTPALAENIRNLATVTKVATEEALVRRLKRHVCDIRYEADDSYGSTVMHRNSKDGRQYIMLYSDNCRKVQHGRLIAKGRYVAECYDAETGSIAKMPTEYTDGNTVVAVTIAEGSSVLIGLIPSTDSDAEVAENTAVPEIHLPLKKLTCQPNFPNVLTLEICSYKTTDMTDFSEEYAVECVTELLKRQKYSGKVTLRFRFLAECPMKGLRLAVEEPECCEIALNGVKVDSVPDGYYFAKSFRILKLPDDVKGGENVITVTRLTKPQIQEKINDDMKHLFELFQAPVGVDLERMHIIGDFTVDTISMPTNGGMTRIAREFMMCPAKPVPASSNMTVHGYPFYIGSMTYTAKFAVPSVMNRQSLKLRVGEMNGATAEVFVNGVRTGSLNRSPYTVTVGKYLKDGENTVSIKVYSTLRNAIGPSHINGYDHCGCHRGVWPQYLLPVTAADTAAWTGDFGLTAFGIGSVELQSTLSLL